MHVCPAPNRTPAPPPRPRPTSAQVRGRLQPGGGPPRRLPGPGAGPRSGHIPQGCVWVLHECPLLVISLNPRVCGFPPLPSPAVVSLVGLPPPPLGPAAPPPSRDMLRNPSFVTEEWSHVLTWGRARGLLLADIPTVSVEHDPLCHLVTNSVEHFENAESVTESLLTNHRQTRSPNPTASTGCCGF